MKLKQKIVIIYIIVVGPMVGSPRINQKLLREGYQVSKKRVERLMQELDICAVAKKEIPCHH